jgi:hypothetical protein
MNALRFLMAFLLTLPLLLSAPPSPAADETSAHRPGLRDQWQPQTEHDSRLAQPVHIEILGRAAVPALEMLSKETGVTLQVAPENLDTVGERKLTIISKGLSLKAIMVQLPEALQECHWDVDVQGKEPVYLLHRNGGVDYSSPQWVEAQRSLARRPKREARIEEARRALAMSPEQLAELEKSDLFLARSVRSPQSRAMLELFLSLPQEDMEPFLDTGETQVGYAAAPERFRLAADRLLRDARSQYASRQDEIGRALSDLVKSMQDDPSQIGLRYEESEGLVYLRVTLRPGPGGGLTEPALWPRFPSGPPDGWPRSLLLATGCPDEQAADALFQEWSQKGTEEERRQRWVEPSDPELHRRVALTAEGVVQLSDVEQMIAAQTSFSVISDYLTLMLGVPEEARADLPLWRVLNILGDCWRYRWKAAGSCLVFHHQEWYARAGQEIPERIVLAYREKLANQGRLTLDDVAAFAVALGHPVDLTAVPLDLLEAGIFAPAVSPGIFVFYASLSPEQRREAEGPTGLSFAAMSPAQQGQVRQRAAALTPPVPPDQLAAAVFRLRESILEDESFRRDRFDLDLAFGDQLDQTVVLLGLPQVPSGTEPTDESQHASDEQQK